MTEHENNFESLRRLLALKRHEVPPPGYFNNFSGRVMQRIAAGECGAAEPISFLDRLQHWFDFKPAFAGGFAGSLCLLLLFGIVYAERSDLTPPLLAHADVTAAPLAPMSPPGLPSSANSIGIVSSTNPVLDLQAFASTAPAFTPQNPFAQNVGFTLPGN